MKKLLTFLGPAFQGDNGKASAPKITAFWFATLVTIVHIIWLKKAFLENNFTYMSELLYGDEATIITLLGLKVWERVKANQTTTDETK